MQRYLDHRGFFPKGIHQHTWQTLENLEMDDWRRELLARAKNFCLTELSVFTNTPNNLYLAGSFFSDKERPNDIEINLNLTQDPGTVEEFTRLLSITTNHDKIEADLQLDVWTTAPIINPQQNDFCQFFQYVGPKSAQLKNLDPKDKRGIIEVTQWQHG